MGLISTLGASVLSSLRCTRLPAVHLFGNPDLILSWGTEAKAVSQELTLTTTNS